MNEFAQWKGCLDILARRLGTLAPTVAPVPSEPAWVDIPRLALEIDCGDLARPLDYHQFLRKDDDISPLFAWAARCDLAHADSLRALIGEWTRPGSPLDLWAEVLFLEFDTAPSGEPAGVSVFLRGVSGGEDQLMPAFEMACALTGASARGPRLRAGLDAIRACLPEPVHVGAIGWMIGRDGGLRVNVHALRVGDAHAFFAALGLASAAEAAEMFEQLADLADKVTVALDLVLADDGGASTRLSGFECFMEMEPANEPRWRLLADLAETVAGAQPDAMSTLLAAPCSAFPGDAQLRWPDAWLSSAITAARDEIPEARVRLSHLKLCPSGRGGWRAKAYLAAERVTRPPPAPAAHHVPSGPVDESFLRAARDRGLRFLLAGQDQGGFWRDFDGPIGLADEWSTAVIGYALVTLGNGTALDAAVRANDALARRRRPGGGWGFSRHLPLDGDSTAWVLHLMRAIGADTGPDFAEALKFVARHVLPDGGVTAYAPDTPIRFHDCPKGTDDSGFRATHPCVAVAAGPLLGHEPMAWLASQQRADGSLFSYWWTDDAYATAMAIVLAPPGGPVDLARARDWLAATAPDHETDAFGTALRLLGLADASQDHGPVRETLLARLADLQNLDGSWPSGAQVLRPQPWIREPSIENSYNHRDHRRLFTTAFAVWALDRSLKAGSA
jgi:hypothetical protein